MVRKLWVLMVILCIAVAPTFRADAQGLQERSPIIIPSGNGEADRLRHEIHDLLKQENLLRLQLEETLARARKLRSQMRLVHRQIIADQEKLDSLVRGPYGRKRSPRPPTNTKTKAPDQPRKAIPIQPQI